MKIHSTCNLYEVGERKWEQNHGRNQEVAVKEGNYASISSVFHKNFVFTLLCYMPLGCFWFSRGSSYTLKHSPGPLERNASHFFDEGC